MVLDALVPLVIHRDYMKIFMSNNHKFVTKHEYLHEGPPLFIIDNLVEKEVRNYLKTHKNLSIYDRKSETTYVQIDKMIQSDSRTIVITRDSYIAMKHYERSLVYDT